MKSFSAYPVFLGSLLAFVVLACNSEAGIEQTPSHGPVLEQVLLKAHAVFGHEVRTIRPCGEDEPIWAIDSTGLLWDLHRDVAPGLEQYEEVFTVVLGSAGDAPMDGFGADYGSSFVVDQVLYVAGEGFGCDLDLSRFHFRLSGNEPFWTLNILGETAELSRMDAPGQTWSALRLGPAEAGISYLAEVSGSGSLDVSILEEPCRDSMSGAYYGYSATVMLDGEELHGCALRGAGQ